MEKAKILVVEDNSLVALDICQSLKEFGYEVFAPVSSGEKAILVAQEKRPDVIVMDIRLAGAMDGITSAAYISDTCEIPVIFLTAHADKSTLERAKIVEPFAYLLKPFENIELHAAIQMLLYQSGWEARANDSSLKSPPKSDSSSSTGKLEFLKSLPFFSGLQDTELSALANASQLQHLAKDETLFDFTRSEIPAFLVLSGRIAMVQTETGLENGSDEKQGNPRELILDLVEPGDLYGIISAVDTIPTSAFPRANRESEVLIIPKKTFVLLLEAYPNLAIGFAEYVTRRLRLAQVFTRALAYDDVQTRIEKIISELALRAGSDEEMVVLDITRKELAQLAGTTVETVVRVLKLLEAEKIVELGQRRRLQVRNPGAASKKSTQDFCISAE